MALIWMDSFDLYGSGTGGAAKMLDGVYAQVQGAATIPTNTQVRTGLFSLGYTNPGAINFVRRIFGANKTTVGVGFAVYMEALPTSSTVTYFAKFLNGGGTAVCTITMDTTGAIEVRTGSEAGTVRGTSAPVIVTTAWQHIEIKVLFSATVGTCEVRVNETTVLNLTNINTDGAAGGVASNVSIGRNSSGASVYYIDDLYAWDTSGSYNNTFIGDKKVYTLYPNGDTSVADWAPDSGSVGYSRINETTPNDANYIQADTINDTSEFNFDDLGNTVSNISAIQASPRMFKSDAGGNDVQVSMVSGASVASGANTSTTTTATYYNYVYEQDPATSSAWTRTGVNNAIVRVDRTL